MENRRQLLALSLFMERKGISLSNAGIDRAQEIKRDGMFQEGVVVIAAVDASVSEVIEAAIAMLEHLHHTTTKASRPKTRMNNRIIICICTARTVS